MTSSPARAAATVEAVQMFERDQRNERCVIDGVHGPHLLRVRIGGPAAPWLDAPCGGGTTTVDKEADRGAWAQL